MASTGRSTLNNNAEDKDRCIDDDCIFPGEDLGQKATVHGTSPSTQLENGSQPAHLGTVLGVVAHVVSEGMHREHTRENPLIIAIKKPADTGKASNAKDAEVLEDGLGAASAGEL